MKNLVYAEGRKKTDNLLAIGLDKILEESYRKSTKHFREFVAFGSTDMPSVEPGKTVTFRKVDPVIEGLMALDHAKDMGGVQIWDDVDTDVAMKVGTLNVHYNVALQVWHFRDDRGVNISMTDAFVRQLPAAGFMHKDKLRQGLFVIRPNARGKMRHYGGGKMLRSLIVEDDRGCRYPVEPTRPTLYIHSPIPNRNQFDPMSRAFIQTQRTHMQTQNIRFDGSAWRLEDPNQHFPLSFSGSVTSPNKQQGGANMAQVKETTEKPIQQQPVKLGVYFRVNSMPQELTQKQANEHVAKLLTLGADQVSVQRYIRDETSERYTNQTDYR